MAVVLNIVPSLIKMQVVCLCCRVPSSDIATCQYVDGQLYLMHTIYIPASPRRDPSSRTLLHGHQHAEAGLNTSQRPRSIGSCLHLF
ncbi:hypothetical protein HZ326_5798 [Fusarium oxysporum f. sp. albedinis]|nr:hypothetical protein HZ326_5798 [Fusarium oxysporum f. sp. albedinis]